MNAGRNRLIFIDSYNKYNFDSFIEPTVEGYGNGYGKTYRKSPVSNSRKTKNAR